MPSGLGGRAGSDISIGHVFSQCVLAAITLVGGRGRVGGARARARCKLGLLLCSLATTTSRVGSEPQGLEQEP